MLRPLFSWQPMPERNEWWSWDIHLVGQLPYELVL
jgi:hypothetical protein